MNNDTISLTDPAKQGYYTENRDPVKGSKAHIIVEITEYLPGAVVSRTNIKKTSGNITLTSFDTGEEFAEKTSLYDTFIQVMDGAAEVLINEKTYLLRLGNGIVIPAHASHCINANKHFKMISTVIRRYNEESKEDQVQ